MKFAKDFSQDLVPEWRIKYLDYKLGKKKVKAVARALQRINQTPRTPFHKTPTQQGPRTWLFGNNETPPLSPQFYDEEQDEQNTDSRGGSAATGHLNAGDGSNGRSQAIQSLREVESQHPSPVPDGNVSPEEQPLRGSQGTPASGLSRNYGSLQTSTSPGPKSAPIGPPSLNLPDPALSPSQTLNSRRGHLNALRDDNTQLRRDATQTGDAYEVGRTHTPSKMNNTLLPKHRNIFRPRRTFSTPHEGVGKRSPFRRMISLGGDQSETIRSPDVQLESYRDFDSKQAEFFAWLDKEYNKIESFYLDKENEAAHRLQVLKEQLHIMRDRRVQELNAARQNGNGKAKKQNASDDNVVDNGSSSFKVSSAPRWVREFEDAVGIGSHRFGKNSAALSKIASEAANNGNPSGHLGETRRDFSRKPVKEDVSYRTAKRKLKMALQEFYRGLELLKSYALLNRTAFRKINKKYDKAVQARPPLRYMSEKVNKAWFVQSEKLDMLLVSVEDLYARYFERGNHKVAVGKLRSNSNRHSYSGSVFRNGVFLAAGIVFGIEGLVDAIKHLNHPDPAISLQTSYLLQLYGGYFLALFLTLMFVLVCRIWVLSKINYVFIFEFDTRSSLDWRQLGEALYYQSRSWFLYSNFRLLLAGVYPVEFRDFFLGDMFCSLTYAMGNIEVFFCLYSHNWINPTQCNSSHSRILGFLSAVPGIWRALQCLRRYLDTRNKFPHMVNFGKYLATCMFNMSLSLYRINRSTEHYVLFILFGVINGIYTSVWDLAMDWSLLNPYAAKPFLRDVLGYKRAWWYYLAMVIDPILRFNWLLYVILSTELQHSAALSFIVSISEVCRRSMWMIFRVENEHCTNVGRFRASRDVPLPYETSESIAEDPVPEANLSPIRSRTSAAIRMESNDPEHGTSTGFPNITPQLRRRQTFGGSVTDTPTSLGRGLQRVGTIMAAAHAQDFERKRRPVVSAVDGRRDNQADGDSSDDEDDEDDAGAGAEDGEEQNQLEIDEAENILSRHRSATAKD